MSMIPPCAQCGDSWAAITHMGGDPLLGYHEYQSPPRRAWDLAVEEETVRRSRVQRARDRAVEARAGAAAMRREGYLSLHGSTSGICLRFPCPEHPDPSTRVRLRDYFARG